MPATALITVGEVAGRLRCSSRFSGTWTVTQVVTRKILPACIHRDWQHCPTSAVTNSRKPAPTHGRRLVRLQRSGEWRQVRLDVQRSVGYVQQRQQVENSRRVVELRLQRRHGLSEQLGTERVFGRTLSLVLRQQDQDQHEESGLHSARDAACFLAANPGACPTGRAQSPIVEQRPQRAEDCRRSGSKLDRNIPT